MNYKQLLIILCLGCLITASTEAQMKRFRIVPKYIEFNPKLEFKVLGGLSLPLGQYAELTDYSNERSAASNGYFGEIRILQRSPLKPLWSLQLSLGYMQHTVAVDSIINAFQLATFQSDNWQHYYFMPGIGFRGGTRLRFELHAAAGLLVFNGFNARRAVLGKNQVMDVISWEYPYAIGGAIRAGASLGFKVNKRWTIFAEANYWLGRGRREGLRITEEFFVDPVQQFAIEPPIYSIEEAVFDSAIFNMVNFGLGIKYRAYKHFYNPNAKYWNYY